jgi:hypothetical protein
MHATDRWDHQQFSAAVAKSHHLLEGSNHVAVAEPQTAENIFLVT